MRESVTVVAVVSAPPSPQLGEQVRMREIPRAVVVFWLQCFQRSSVNWTSLNDSLCGLTLSFFVYGSAT